MRPSQWTKNAVIFAAFIFAIGDRQQTVTFGGFWPVVEAAALFCLLSSSIYIFNDLKDLELDRAHPTKCKRPIAAGDLSPLAAVFLGFLLMCVALTGAALLSTQFLGVAVTYVLLQLVYTLGLKQVALVDLFMIAAGFVLRATAGAVVLKITISPWLLLCTLLLALFLALCKRRHEKAVLAEVNAETRPSLAGYDTHLLDQLIAIVSAATIVCYALYTLWPDTVDKFGTTRLGLTVPFVIFGLFRYLDLVYRHDKGERPERILLTDIPLIVDLLLYGCCVLLVMFWPF
jgi:4-hydroxybenzoate polyprenyltransferase